MKSQFSIEAFPHVIATFSERKISRIPIREFSSGYWMIGGKNIQMSIDA